MFLTFSQLPNKYIVKSNKTQILNTQQKKIHQIRDQPKIREQQNENHPRHHNNNKKIRDQREQADRRWDRPKASRSAIRRDDLGFDEWVWRMVRRFLGSRRSVTNGFGDFWVCDLRNGFDDVISLSLYLSVCASESFLLSLSLSLWALLNERARSWVFWVRQSSWMWIDLAFACARVLVRSLFLAVSLSFLFSWGGSDLKWKWERKLFFALLALFYSQTENIFSLTKFSVTAKHPLFRKSIFGISLKPKQTEPKCLY